jgi:hypothetical protein
MRRTWLGQALHRAQMDANVHQLALEMPTIIPTRHEPPATTTRALSIRDVLSTLDSNARRVYRPLTVAGLPGTWAARQWMHCGGCDGVLLVRWEDRENTMASGYWAGLADGRVRLVVTQQEAS